MAAKPDLFTFTAEEAKRQGLDPELALLVLGQESGGRAGAVSSAGARGPMQLMPDTAASLGVDHTDPYDNVRGGVTYLKRQMDAFGTPELALAAYNAGPAAVLHYGGVPPFKETQNYVSTIMAKHAKAAAPASPDDLAAYGEPVEPAKAGKPEDLTAFGMEIPVATAAPRSLMERFTATLDDAVHRNPIMSGIRAAMAHALPDFDLADPNTGDPTHFPGAGADMARIERERRNLYGQETAADPFYKAPGGIAGKAAAGAVTAAGGLAGSLLDPLNLILGAATGGESLIGRMAVQGGINAALDVPSQLADISAGIEDKYHPEQTAMSGAVGAAFPAAGDLAGAAANYAGRTIPELARALRQMIEARRAPAERQPMRLDDDLTSFGEPVDPATVANDMEPPASPRTIPNGETLDSFDPAAHNLPDGFYVDPKTGQGRNYINFGGQRPPPPDAPPVTAEPAQSPAPSGASDSGAVADDLSQFGEPVDDFPGDVSRNAPESAGNAPAEVSGAEPDITDRALDTLRSGGKVKVDQGPSLIEFLSQKGIDDRDGEIAHIGGDRWHKDKAFRARLGEGGRPQP
jgi:hypothetical protein